jgi:hypothetical protein
LGEIVCGKRYDIFRYLERIGRSEAAAAFLYMISVESTSAGNLPKGGVLNETTGVLTWRPAAAADGGETFEVVAVATGARGDKPTASFMLAVREALFCSTFVRIPLN